MTPPPKSHRIRAISAPVDVKERHLYLRGIILSTVGIIIISPDGLLIRLVEQANIFQIVFYRMLFLGLALLIALVVYYRRRLAEVAAGLGWRGIGAGVLMAATNFGFVAAMLNTSVANTLVMLTTIPLFSALFSRLFLKERVKPHTALAIAMAFAGVVVIVYGSVGRPSLLGDGIALVSAAAQGLNLTLLRGLGNRDTTPAVCMSGFLAAAAAAPLAGSLMVSAYDFGIVALQGGLQLPLAIVLFVAGARYAPAAEVGLVVLIETTLGPLWAWLGIGEVPSAATFAGGSFVLLAVAMNSSLSSRNRRASRHQR